MQNSAQNLKAFSLTWKNYFVDYYETIERFWFVQGRLELPQLKGMNISTVISCKW
jgi:hypothetical protein